VSLREWGRGPRLRRANFQRTALTALNSHRMRLSQPWPRVHPSVGAKHLQSRVAAGQAELRSSSTTGICRVVLLWYSANCGNASACLA